MCLGTETEDEVIISTVYHQQLKLATWRNLSCWGWVPKEIPMQPVTQTNSKTTWLCGCHWNMDTYSAILSNIQEYILNKSSCNGKVLRHTTIIHEYAQMIMFKYTCAYYRHATLGSSRLVKALHTTSILSMLATSVSPLCSVAVYLFFISPIIHSRWIWTFDNYLGISTSFWESWFLPRVNAGISSLAPCRAMSDDTVKTTITKHNISRFKKR